MSDPRELAALVRERMQRLEHQLDPTRPAVWRSPVNEAYGALDALVAECERLGDLAEAQGNMVILTEAALEEMRRERDAWEHAVTEREKFALARARRYEEALWKIAEAASERVEHGRPDINSGWVESVARAALTEEQNTVGGGQVGC